MHNLGLPGPLVEEGVTKKCLLLNPGNLPTLVGFQLVILLQFCPTLGFGTGRVHFKEGQETLYPVDWYGPHVTSNVGVFLGKNGC